MNSTAVQAQRTTNAVALAETARNASARFAIGAMLAHWPGQLKMPRPDAYTLLFWSTVIARPVEDAVDLQFNRLEAKYTGNKTMILTLAKLRRNWREYQSTQCFLERTAATGGQVVKGSSASAEKVHQTCLARTEAEMKAALQNL